LKTIRSRKAKANVLVAIIITIIAITAIVCAAYVHISLTGTVPLKEFKSSNGPGPPSGPIGLNRGGFRDISPTSPPGNTP
jgi:hypothetical protein